ncbi:MAG: alpha/beta hydrolase [Bacillaceae bacterium]
MKKFTKPFLIVFAVFVIIAGGVGYYFSNVLLLPEQAADYTKNPDNKEAITTYNKLKTELNGERITIPSTHSYNLIGDYFPAKEETTRTVVSVHGYTSSKAQQAKFIRMFHNLGFNVISYDHRNHGESGGSYTTYGLLESEDLKTVVDYAKDRFGQDAMIGIHGVSMGAATTLLYGGMVEDGADFYIADCAYSNFKEEAEYRLAEDYPIIPSFLHKPIVFLGDFVYKMRSDFSIAEASPLKHIKNIKKPVLFINTKTDEYIPPYMTDELYAAKEGTKSLYLTETGEHAKAFDVNPKQYTQEVIGFLKANF